MTSSAGAGSSVDAGSSPGAGRIAAYQVGSRDMPIVPAPPARDWMSATGQRFANRCLPLLIANQSGWLLLNDVEFQAIWTGHDGPDQILIQHEPATRKPLARSHFGHGILTWNIPYVFRTPPGINLLARGPANMPKDAIAPLEGIIESDWASATFTMNWKFTRTMTPVLFEAGEPVCMIVPQHRGELERFRPEIIPVQADTALQQQFTTWSESRDAFLAQQSPGWQRHYFRGNHADGSAGHQEHQTRLHLAPFRPASS